MSYIDVHNYAQPNGTMAPERKDDPSRSTETDRVPRSLNMPAAPDMPPIVHGVVDDICQSRRNEHLVE